jgi:uncharacterized membrane protein YphA (DoxX/SURF4 family)
MIVILRFVMGVFWVEHSREKWDWPRTGELQKRLQRWNDDATGVRKVYLESFALPHWQTLQYLAMFGELAVGLSFIVGLLMRTASVGGAFMALNFLFAQGSISGLDFLGNPYGPVVITATIVAAWGGGEAVASFGAMLRRATARPPLQV